MLIKASGILYKICKTAGDVSLQSCVPSVLTQKIIGALHNYIVSCHLGVKKTLRKVKMYFYWDEMKRDVKEWCKRRFKYESRKYLYANLGPD